MHTIQAANGANIASKSPPPAAAASPPAAAPIASAPAPAANPAAASPPIAPAPMPIKSAAPPAPADSNPVSAAPPVSKPVASAPKDAAASPLGVSRLVVPKSIPAPVPKVDALLANSVPVPPNQLGRVEVSPVNNLLKSIPLNPVALPTAVVAGPPNIIAAAGISSLVKSRGAVCDDEVSLF